MALEIPTRGYGARVNEQVSTPQVDVKKFSSVADALNNLGGTAATIGIDLMKKKQEADASAFLTKAMQEYNLEQLNASQRMMKNLDENGKDRDTGMNYTDSMELWTQSKIDDLSAKAPSEKARSLFSQRITPRQTKHIIEADLHETALYTETQVRLDGDIARNYGNSVHAMKSGSVYKGEEYLADMTEMFTRGVGTKYDIRAAKQNIETYGNELAYAAGQAAVRNEDIKGLEDLLLGTIRGQNIKMPGLDIKDIDKREISPLEEHLTPPQKNALLNKLEDLYHKRSKKELESIGQTRQVLQNTLDMGEYDPSKPGHSKMPMDLLKSTYNYRDLKGNRMPWRMGVDNMVTAIWETDVIDYMRKNPFKNEAELAKVLNGKSAIANKKIRDIVHDVYKKGGELDVPDDVLKNAIQATIQNKYKKIFAERHKQMNKDPGEYAISNNQQLGDKFNSIDISNPSSIASSGLGKLMDDIHKHSKALGVRTENMDPLPKKFYENTARIIKQKLKDSDPLSDDISDHLYAFKQAMGPDKFNHFAEKLKEVDSTVGELALAAGTKDRTEDLSTPYFKEIATYHSPTHIPRIEQWQKEDPENRSMVKLKEKIKKEMTPGFFSMSGTDVAAGVYEPTLQDISQVAGFHDVVTEIAKVQTTLMAIRGMDKKDAMEEAIKMRFDGTQFIKENNSIIALPKNSKVSANEMRSVIDGLSNPSDMIKHGLGPKNVDELKTMVGSEKAIQVMQQNIAYKLQDPSHPLFQDYMSGDDVRKKQIEDEMVMNEFKDNYGVKWSNAPGGNFSAEYIRKDSWMGVVNERFGDTVKKPINPFAPEAISGYRIDSQGNRSSILLTPDDIPKLVPHIKGKPFMSPGKRVPQSVIDTPSSQAAATTSVAQPIIDSTMEGIDDRLKGMLDKEKSKGGRKPQSLSHPVISKGADGLTVIDNEAITIQNILEGVEESDYEVSDFSVESIKNILAEQENIYSSDPEYRPRMRVYTPLSEEQMDLYEQDPERYEQLEDEGIIDEVFK